MIWFKLGGRCLKVPEISGIYFDPNLSIPHEVMEYQRLKIMCIIRNNTLWFGWTHEKAVFCAVSSRRKCRELVILQRNF